MALVTKTSALAALEAARPEIIDGEPVIFRAHLSDAWLRWRCVSCCCAFTWGGLSLAFPFAGLVYLACGPSRREEFRSFDLHVTPTAIHFSQKMYDCGCCCQSTVRKSIPLDKIQDVILVSNCCGDCCGFAPKGSPWQVHIQTAGSSIANGGRAGAELVVMCLQSPEEFRSQVLAAKRRAADPAAMAAYARTGASAGAASGVSVGAGKEGGGAGGIELRSGSGGGGGDNAAVVAVLERIERALNEGIALAASRSGGAGVASAGAGGAPASYGGGAALSGLGGVYPSTGAGR